MNTTEHYEIIASQLGDVHKKLRRIQTKMLGDYNISLLEFHIISTLMRVNSLNQNELAEKLNVDKALISRQVQYMQEKGLVFCTIDESCRRKKVLTLGQKAQEIIPILKDVHKRSLESLFSNLEEKQLFELQGILERINC